MAARADMENFWNTLFSCENAGFDFIGGLHGIQ